MVAVVETTRAVLVGELLACHGRLGRLLDVIGAVAEPATVDAETVHRLRTNARRARAALRVGRNAWGRKRCAALENGLRESACRLAPVRELDVLAASGARAVDEGRLDAETWERVAPVVAQKRHDAIVAAVLPVADVMARAMDGLLGLASEVPKHRKRADGRARDAFEDALQQARRRAAQRRPETFHDAPDDLLHAYRLAVKRVRDTMRVFRPVLTKRESDELAGLKAQLDPLGATQDAASGRTWLVAWMSADLVEPDVADAVIAALGTQARLAREALRGS